jgi:histone acetyltransferase (RNA polymerase elongator complex component)
VNLVIPVFIPHEGCAHSCVFCNQRKISGVRGEPVNREKVALIIRRWLEWGRGEEKKQVQVAFYGGSFTCLSIERQEELLGAVSEFIDSKDVDGIRLSTRADAVNQENLALLKSYFVQTVELGVQSLDDSVLGLSRRGHTGKDCFRASELIRKSGLELGLQLMVGLPGQNFTSIRQTISGVLAINPDFIRIYPVLVVEGSLLARWFKQGKYQPLSVGKAVVLSAWIKKKCNKAGIHVIRIGLQAGAELENSFISGPYHPAFGELVASRLMLRKTRSLLMSINSNDKVTLCISSRDQSVFKGMKSANMKRLAELGLAERFLLKFDPNQLRGTIISQNFSDKNDIKNEKPITF